MDYHDGRIVFDLCVPSGHAGDCAFVERQNAVYLRILVKCIIDPAVHPAGPDWIH